MFKEIFDLAVELAMASIASKTLMLVTFQGSFSRMIVMIGPADVIMRRGKNTITKRVKNTERQCIFQIPVSH
jgi:hypothetical protein